MARRGLREVVLVPLLLFSAGHAERDIPAAAAQAAAARRTDACGRPPYWAATRRSWHSPPSDFARPRLPTTPRRKCCGCSSDGAVVTLTATAEMDRFVAGRVALTPVGRVVVAFLAMAEPRVEAVVPQIAAMDLATVVVQPHLLYPGTLLSRLQRIVDVQDRGRLRQQWILAECLGCDRAIAQVVVERFRETAAEAGWPGR